MKLRQINKGHKCPNCKKFGLKPYHIDTYGMEHEGKTLQGFYFNYLKCLNCFAEFQEVEDGK